MPDETDRVIVSRNTARAALTEVEAAIRRTGGGDVGADEACTPLALARQRIEADDELADGAKDHVLSILEDVSDDRGVELSGADPLTDATFQAEKALTQALEADGATYVVADSKSPDEEDVFREELHDVAHGMVTTAFIFDSEDRGLTGFKVSTDSIEWVDFTRQEA